MTAEPRPDPEPAPARSVSRCCYYNLEVLLIQVPATLGPEEGLDGLVLVHLTVGAWSQAESSVSPEDDCKAVTEWGVGTALTRVGHWSPSAASRFVWCSCPPSRPRRPQEFFLGVSIPPGFTSLQKGPFLRMST